jgi:hypothetical protein
MSADSRPARTGNSLQQSPSRMSGSVAFQRAKALLASWFGLAPGEAENLLLTWSCENKMSACELATALVSDIDAGRPSGCSDAVLRYLEARLREVGAAAESTSSARTRKESDRGRGVEAGTGDSPRARRPAMSTPFPRDPADPTGPFPEPDVDPDRPAPDPGAEPDSEPALDREPDAQVPTAGS